ncbi:MAG: adenine phosphoribosyltransferase [Candidatus Eremiobacteraeota bacterium]|nr:adenine phosphoribosyltransferase [Candidatus Eremiobacteraeota bacterium]MBV8364940.1 adenine phosphoribosyltransferase [Candidatus Eremiobacteraeota bacterium]
MTTAELKDKVRAIPDFPIPGILFRDITPVLQDPASLRAAIDLMSNAYKDAKIDIVVGIEARGYILGAPLAYKIGAGFVPVRKPGKLPFEKISVDYALEYGTNTLEMHSDAIAGGHRVLVVDDLLATGGTAAAVRKMVDQVGGELIGFAFLIELTALDGRSKLPGVDIKSFITY